MYLSHYEKGKATTFQYSIAQTTQLPVLFVVPVIKNHIMVTKYTSKVIKVFIQQFFNFINIVKNITKPLQAFHWNGITESENNILRI